MAIYKAAAGSPIQSEVIDGQQWTLRNGGGTIHGWGYPKSSPSDQFTRYDVNAAQLDTEFTDFPAPDQTAWNAAAEGIDDILFCENEEYYYG